MTKTQAAKAFAEKYGSFNGEKYSLLSYPTRFDIGHATSDAEVEALRDRLKEARRTHTSDLRLVMALLGVEDQYQDTVETRETAVGQRVVGMTYGSVLGPRPQYETVYEDQEVTTETGLQKFAADLRAAQSALDGAAALKRLRKAIKNVQKESDK